jgi:m7GpppX diphosphatase
LLGYPKKGIFAGKAVLLEDIIYNLSRNGDHYEKATLNYVIGEHQHATLYQRLLEAGVLSPPQ